MSKGRVATGKDKRLNNAIETNETVAFSWLPSNTKLPKEQRDICNIPSAISKKLTLKCRPYSSKT